MTCKQIQAIGNFLACYDSDLNYIRRFKEFKSGLHSPSLYIQKDNGSFYSFLIEFRVVRNFSKGATDKLLEETILWVNGNTPDDVDAFADRLATINLTRNKTMVSMASKILFLNNPHALLPIDSLVRKAVLLKQNRYSDYKNKLINFIEDNIEVIQSSMNNTNHFASIINDIYASDIDDLDTIRKNRIIDKLLWTIGK